MSASLRLSQSKGIDLAGKRSLDGCKLLECVTMTEVANDHSIKQKGLSISDITPDKPANKKRY